MGIIHRFRPSGWVHPKWAGDNITATLAGTSSDSGTLTDAGGGELWRANEPAGMTQITSRSYDAVTEDGWGSNGSSNLSIVSRSSAPHSPSNVLSGLFPEGIDNATPWTMYLENLTSNGHRRVYYATWFRVRADFWGVSKFMFLKPIEPDGTPGATHFINIERDGGSGTACDFDGFRLRGQTQGAQTNTVANYFNNVTETIFNYDQWILFETELFFGDPGSSNGEWRWWIDGVKQAEYTGEDWFSTGDADTGKLYAISHEPTWNDTFCSGTGPNPNDGHWEFDESYASGKAS